MSTPVNPITSNPAVAAGAAITAALLPLAGPDGQLAATVLSQGLAFWADYSTRLAAGKLTLADVQAAADGLSLDMAKLAADIAAAP